MLAETSKRIKEGRLARVWVTNNGNTVGATTRRRGCMRWFGERRSRRPSSDGHKKSNCLSLRGKTDALRLLTPQGEVKPADTDLHWISKRGTTHDLNRLAGGKTELGQALSKPVGTCYRVDAALFVWCEISKRLHSRTRVYFRIFF